MSIMPAKQLARGDSANTLDLAMPNHIGSHVDAPRHFIADGASVDQYPADDWIFEHPILIDATVSPAVLIDADRLARACPSPDRAADLVFLQTGAARLRGSEDFWRAGPGVAGSGARWIIDHFPKIRALGLDSISLSSFAHRAEGRTAHRLLLERGIRLFEDLDLAAIPAGSSLVRVIGLPLRLQDGDGAPVTMIGEIA